MRLPLFVYKTHAFVQYRIPPASSARTSLQGQLNSSTSAAAIGIICLVTKEINDSMGWRLIQECCELLRNPQHPDSAPPRTQVNQPSAVSEQLLDRVARLPPPFTGGEMVMERAADF
jgi:hypothetical protein